jgi:hypothetical protein
MANLMAATTLLSFTAFLVFVFRAAFRRSAHRPGKNIWWALAFLLSTIGAGNVIAATPASSTANAPKRATRQKGWNRKAVPTARMAAHEAGGFSNDEARAYSNGLAHIRNAHKTLGKYTIAQVVDEERQRASKRKDEQQSAKQAAQDIVDARVARAAEAVELANAKQADRDAAAERAVEANTMHGDPDCLTMSRNSVSASTDEINAVSVTGVIKNGCDKEFHYVQVEVSFYKEDGTTQTTSGLDNLDNFEAGNTWSFKAMGMDTGGGRYQVTKISGY